jgi:hypothetical protein
MSSRSPLNLICFTGFALFALSRFRTLLISIQRTSANSCFALPVAFSQGIRRQETGSQKDVCLLTVPSFRFVRWETKYAAHSV